MQKLDIDARGKINLTLDVLCKRPDGYHEVEMIMQTIALKDIVSLKLTSQPSIKLNSNCPQLTRDEENLAYQAARLMMQQYRLDAGISITISKNIPLGAGLAGGSADAAAVIVGINELFELKRPQAELMSLGKKIGADVPFCIMGKTALSRGIGEKLSPLKSLSGFGVLLVKPPYFVSTKEVYNRLDVKNIKNRPDTKAMVDHIKHQNIDKIASGLCNVLEEVTLKLYPELDDIKNLLIQKGALGSLMSGSGPTVFGLFENTLDAKRAADDVAYRGNWIFVTEMK
ncbi:MAG TPA: 4-(cytidine 5'-diphospho)-2-C-methyl-D-erythritol kinase [Thermoanaerobacterales bacterium]|nr:4-(cytidine 5'-diphospho)-2-C-methyl-D-erythritol kinase [Thermoanaerobacterales bacterium]